MTIRLFIYFKQVNGVNIADAQVVVFCDQSESTANEKKK